MNMIADAYEMAKNLLSEHRETMDKIAAFLIEKETITGKEFMKIFRAAEAEAKAKAEAEAEAQAIVKAEAEALAQAAVNLKKETDES
jgi:cell division protease FtsH